MSAVPQKIMSDSFPQQEKLVHDWHITGTQQIWLYEN